MLEKALYTYKCLPVALSSLCACTQQNSSRWEYTHIINIVGLCTIYRFTFQLQSAGQLVKSPKTEQQRCLHPLSLVDFVACDHGSARTIWNEFFRF